MFVYFIVISRLYFFVHVVLKIIWITTAKRTPRNIYVLNEIGKERCFLGKDDEICLWHRRMGHINFDNLVKINRRELVR
jgi:hypothetical protein